MAAHYAKQAEKAVIHQQAFEVWNVAIERKEAERAGRRQAKRAASLRVVK